MDWIKLKIRSPQVGAPLLRIQLIVNPAFANGSIPAPCSTSLPMACAAPVLS